MPSHLTENQVEAFCRRTLAAVELLRVDEHLAECDSCRQRLAQAEFPQHLSFDQTADFVDGRLTGEALQLAGDHLATCNLCRAAVDDLQSFRSEVADELSRKVQPAPIEVESFWQRAKSFLAARSPILVYSAGLILLLAGAWLARQLVFKSDKPQVATTNPTPTPSPEVAPVKLLAQLNDGGGTLALNERGELSGAENLPADFQQLLKQVLTDPRLERPAALNGLGSPSAALMSGGSEKAAFAVIEPVAKVLLTNRPTLRWRALAGATAYEVEVFDDNFNSVLKSEQLQVTSWRVSEPLVRGRVYAWQVKAIKDGQEFNAPQPPAPLARFRVLAKKDADAIEQARANLASSHLLLGRLYAEAGLLDEAGREFHALEKANPESEVVKRLLGELRKFQP
ncbi:MAG: zf-HC2 domain-containing protein [Blastocatellia bacterium]